MFTELFIRGAFPATLALSFLNLVPTQLNAGSMLTTTRTEYLPVQAMSHDIGSKSMRGYFVQSNGACSVFLMITEKIDPEAPARLSAARVRLVLQPGAIAGLDSAEGRSLNLTCDKAAAKLLVDEGETSALITQQKARLYN
jgi:hypothetical protein